MTRIGISVEGQTEEAFVKKLLEEHLQDSQVTPTPVLIGRARGAASGGNVTVKRLASDMANLYWNFDYVTSLVDYYGFAGKGDDSPQQLEERILSEVRARIDRDWNPARVFPYVQRHEFEGLLFSDVGAFDSLVDLPDGSVETLREIREEFQSPEDINDNVHTAPSKRIQAIVPRYHKVVDGPLLARQIGLDAICGECPRFRDWIARLQGIGRAD